MRESPGDRESASVLVTGDIRLACLEHWIGKLPRRARPIEGKARALKLVGETDFLPQMLHALGVVSCLQRKWSHTYFYRFAHGPQSVWLVPSKASSGSVSC